LLDPNQGLTDEARAVLRSKLGLPAETPAARSPTNSVPDKISAR
jgi:hypothetical protein